MWEKLPAYLKVGGHQHFMDERRIVVSHQRCKELCVDARIDRVKDVLSGEQLSDIFLYNARTVSHAQRILEDIHRTLSDRSCVFILTDAQARILTLFSVPEVIYWCGQKGILPGTSLREEICGTNAVDLALHYGELAVTKGAQHFCHLFHDWYCVAMPIVGVSGEPIACVDLSCSDEAGLHEKIAVVKLIAEKLTTLFEIGGDKSDNHLSERQRSILSLLAQGLTYKEIGTSLKISPRTVESHLEKLRTKFKASTTAQLIAMTANARDEADVRHPYR